MNPEIRREEFSKIGCCGGGGGGGGGFGGGGIEGREGVLNLQL